MDAFRFQFEIFDSDGDSSTHGVDLLQIAEICRRRGGSGCGGVSRKPTVPRLRQFPAAVGRCRPWSTRWIHAMRGCFSIPIRNIRFRWRFIHAWRGSTADRRDLSKAGWVRLRGCPRHGCRGQAPMGEGALLAKHCFASARTHSRQRLGRTAERGLRRVLPTHTVPPSSQTTQSRLLLLTLPWLEAGAGCNPAEPPTTVGWADAALQLGVDADLITLETCLPTTPDTHQ